MACSTEQLGINLKHNMQEAEYVIISRVFSLFFIYINDRKDVSRKIKHTDIVLNVIFKLTIVTLCR